VRKGTRVSHAGIFHALGWFPQSDPQRSLNPTNGLTGPPYNHRLVEARDLMLSRSLRVRICEVDFDCDDCLSSGVRRCTVQTSDLHAALDTCIRISQSIAFAASSDRLTKGHLPRTEAYRIDTKLSIGNFARRTCKAGKGILLPRCLARNGDSPREAEAFRQDWDLQARPVTSCSSTSSGSLPA